MPCSSLAVKRFSRQGVVSISSISTGRSPVLVCVESILKDHKVFLRGLNDAVYTFYSPLVEGSLGQHTRHSLDHIRKPLEFLTVNKESSGKNLVRYDIRDRCTQVEKDRHAAIEQIEQLEQILYAVPTSNLAQPLDAALMLSADGHEINFDSTFGRELAFAVHHYIHHNAMSKVLLRHHFPEVSVPEGFGMAPSTANLNLVQNE